MSNRWDNDERVEQLRRDMADLELAYRVGACSFTTAQQFDLLTASAALAGQMAADLMTADYEIVARSS